MRALLAGILALFAASAAADEYMGYLGRWVEVTATAYSPHDKRDAAYHATKGKDRWKTAGRVSDVRRRPYGVATPQPGRGLPNALTIPLRTEVIIPLGNGYLDDEPGYTKPENRVFLVDDTGSDIRNNTRETGRMHIDLRVKREGDAFAYNQGQGRHRFRIFVISGRAPVLPPALPKPEPPPVVEPVQRPFAPPALPVLRPEVAPPAPRMETEGITLILAAIVVLGWLHLIRRCL